MSATVRPIDDRESIVVQLETMLQLARDGKFLAIAVAATMPDGAVSTAFRVTRRGGMWPLIGAVENVKRRIFDELDLDTEEL